MKYTSGLAALILVVAGTPAALAQATPAFNPPKTSWGAPDLQGTFSTASITTMQRPAGASGLIVTEEEANKLFNRSVYTMVAKEEAADEKAVTSGKEQLAVLTDGNPDRGYNRFWWDPGSDLGRINGQYRSSWIVEPANGQIPYIDANSRANRSRQITSEEQFADLGSDNPEDRSISERCIWFGSSAGPILGNGMYNNHVQIVQTPDKIMLMGEMIHDVRIISLDGARNPAGVPKWGGDSVGRYEGNTLVVETTNVDPRQNSYISDKGKVTERFTRVGDNQVLYQYSVEDPTKYTQVWKGEMPLNVSKEPIYEYACHEGNYAMFNTLSGGRAYERAGRRNGLRKSIYAGVGEKE